MAFDLVQYFQEQIETQKPELLPALSKEEKRSFIAEINALTLGELISQWRANDKKVYQEITTPDQLYIQEVARHLTTSPDNASGLNKHELEHITAEVFQLQLTELKQLHDTGSHNINSIRELLLGQIEHLSGQADDWVWSTNKLLELKGSKPIPQDELSLEESMKEFNQMVSQHSSHEQEDVSPAVPTWSKIVEPVVALVILWILASAACNIFA
jgi:tRNA A37 N6-isopentenylltransferase MiaA